MSVRNVAEMTGYTWRGVFGRYTLNVSCFTASVIKLRPSENWLYEVKDSCGHVLGRDVRENEHEAKGAVLAIIREKLSDRHTLGEIAELSRSVRDTTRLIEQYETYHMIQRRLIDSGLIVVTPEAERACELMQNVINALAAYRDEVNPRVWERNDERSEDPEDGECCDEACGCSDPDAE